MNIEDEAAERFEALATEGEQLIPDQLAIPILIQDDDSWIFSAWRTRCLAALHAYLPDSHSGVREFEREAAISKPAPASTGVGIMRGLAIAAKEGHLFQRATNLIAAEVFSDFLEMADHLVKANHHHAAASLVGAALEDALRRIATNHKIKCGKRDGLDALNRALAREGVYNAIEQRQIDAWREIRNAADHGRFEDVQPEQVRTMVTGVRDFIGRYLA